MPYHTSHLTAKPSRRPRFRSRVEELRIEARMSRRELAHRTGISARTIWRIEAERERCRRATAERICGVLGVEVGSVFTG